MCELLRLPHTAYMQAEMGLMTSNGCCRLDLTSELLRHAVTQDWTRVSAAVRALLCAAADFHAVSAFWWWDSSASLSWPARS